ncbi:NAD-dependent epimerase/dehydratase family protein [Hamadaea tsunoensis]|uniref:NAD-dependent epimerase/dehydratase family protein n=1 Tax=Hamadaea tsunoensis TaxID=53368 RepID=UPI0004061016|nr:NAD(P)H-binding protein [Hamadaea tsunoensis]
MKVVVFGATGMIGQGVLREALLADDVEAVLTVGRKATRMHHARLTEIEHADLADLSPLADRLAAYDACFFCLGVSSAGMAEDAYRKVTYDLTMAAARPIAQGNPDATFVYVSGAGTDGTERGRSMWARVKGKTENDLFALPFHAYAFRPGYIQPLHGITSRTRLYRALYAITTPLYPVLRRLAPKFVTTTEILGRAMLTVARDGWPDRVLEVPAINEAGAGA